MTVDATIPFPAAVEIAVQDAAAALRQATTVALAASAAGIARFLATGDMTYLEAGREGQRLVESAQSNLAGMIALSKAYAAPPPTTNP